MTKPVRFTSYIKGVLAEAYVCAYLMLYGYKIIAQRYKTKLGEIDIIAKKGDITAFIEVKMRKDRTAALEAVTVRSQKRIIKTAQAYMAKAQGTVVDQYRFDVVVVGLWGKLEHIKNAFIS